MNEISSDYIKAQELDRRIKTSAQLAQQSLYDMCIGFKEMRDSRLYKQLGYSDFGEYCEQETQINRQNVYKYIKVAENLPSEFVSSGRQIGIKKLYLLSSLSESERTELTENNDLESTSVRELERQIKELKVKADKADMLSHRLDDMNNICDTISKQRDKADRRIRQLEGEIKELESRPVEVAVADDSKEVADLKDAMKRVDLDWSQRYSQLEEENLRERRELLQKADNAERDKQEKLSQLKTELENTKAEYEKKLAKNAPAKLVQDDKAVFKAYLSNAVDSINRLCGYIAAHKDSAEHGLFIEKSRQLADMIKTKLEV